jgi:hypothetical protein
MSMSRTLSIRSAKAAFVALGAAGLIVASSACAVAPSAAARTTGRAATAPSTAAVRPHAVGELDCNGFSSVQRVAKANMMCADVRNTVTHSRFYDNGWYIGHDEPSIRFVSSTPGSSDNVTYDETLGTDPAALPTVSHPGSDITHYFELTPAPWFSMDICDPQSTPLLACTPESDANAPHGTYPGGGSAFLELQFYPPGFAPFPDSISCDNTHWCAALNIDSLECTASFSCNNRCTEPVNFSFLETDGVPPGPPSPQLADLSTFSPDAHTLLMNAGDKLAVHIFDASIKGGRALETKVTDVTTGQSGYVIASAANGFMNTDPFNCAGTPFNFQPEYSSAKPANIIPWGPGAYDVNTEFEIGHFEACTSITGDKTITEGSFTDTYATHCHGPYEVPGDKASKLEPNDSPCFAAGDTHGGQSPPDLVTGCEVAFRAIGDLDYDGSPYWPDWPNSTTPDAFPSTFLQQQPTSGGSVYPDIQFVTDNSATENGCNTVTGQGCVLPPPGPGDFYPYWTLAKVGGSCVWEFGNMQNGKTFGGDAEYGKVGPDTIGAFQGPVRPNPTTC